MQSNFALKIEEIAEQVRNTKYLLSDSTKCLRLESFKQRCLDLIEKNEVSNEELTLAEFVIADCERYMGRYIEARKMYQQLIKREGLTESDMARTIKYIACCNYYLGNYILAMRGYNKVIREHKGTIQMIADSKHWGKLSLQNYKRQLRGVCKYRSEEPTKRIPRCCGKETIILYHCSLLDLEIKSNTCDECTKIISK